MKKLFCIIIGLATSYISNGQWTQRASLPSSDRIGAASFVIGTTAYIAGGRDSLQNYLTELWAYDAINNSWTQKASLPNNGKLLAGGFTINNFGYLCTGWISNSTGSQDLLKYDPVLNSWMFETPFPSGVRYGPTNIVLNNKAYIGMGYAPLYNDFWEYDPTISAWTQKASFPPGPRQAFVNFAINGFGYVGTGIDQNGLTNGYIGLNDFNKYDPVLNSWSIVASIPGYPRHSAFVFVIGNDAYVGCGLNGNGTTASPFNDFYKYNSITDTWTTSSPLPSSPRQSGSFFTIGNCGYVFGGMTQSLGGTYYHNDLWQYCLTNGIDENEKNVRFKIKYDVFTNSLQVTCLDMLQNKFALQFYSAIGEKVTEAELKNLNKMHGTDIIKLPKLPSGIYLYRITGSNKMFQSGKLMID